MQRQPGSPGLYFFDPNSYGAHPSPTPLSGGSGRMISSEHLGLAGHQNQPTSMNPFYPNSSFIGSNMSISMGNPMSTSSYDLQTQNSGRNGQTDPSELCSSPSQPFLLEHQGSMGQNTLGQDYMNPSRACSSRRGSRTYVCDVCEKQFVRPSSLATHRLSHTGEKPHSCSTCGKSFSVASNLRRHEMTIHGPRPINESGGSLDYGMQVNGLQSAAIVGSTSSGLLYRRGGDIYENILPQHPMGRSLGVYSTPPHLNQQSRYSTSLPPPTDGQRRYG